MLIGNSSSIQPVFGSDCRVQRPKTHISVFLHHETLQWGNKLSKNNCFLSIKKMNLYRNHPNRCMLHTKTDCSIFFGLPQLNKKKNVEGSLWAWKMAGFSGVSKGPASIWCAICSQTSFHYYKRLPSLTQACHENPLWVLFPQYNSCCKSILLYLFIRIAVQFITIQCSYKYLTRRHYKYYL